MTDILSIVLFASVVGGGLVVLAILDRQSKSRAAAETARQLSNLRAIPPKGEVLESMKPRVPPRLEPKFGRLSEGDREFLETVLESKAMESDNLRKIIRNWLDEK